MKLSPKAIWGLSAIVVLGLPLTMWIWCPLILEAGVLPPDGDTIVIPMFESAVFAALLAPFVAAVTRACTRSAANPIELTAWRRDRPILSIALTVATAVPFAIALCAIESEITAPRGWYGLIWLPYTLTVMLWLALTRAAAIQKRTVA
ncbi:hypothetical protein [Sphingomonas morindae]|uniref:Uncharacterized protein n=1 Tax=Sphingomonas morindae TaxID=1541170 RepID=A0ABY4X5A2_9SPHN|nr:hypothetical protein [Sphingomonas morindae]USI72056.1 hypothetical protein LHA26_12160 [Sphingomonas morindae]